MFSRSLFRGLIGCQANLSSKSIKRLQHVNSNLLKKSTGSPSILQCTKNNQNHKLETVWSDDTHRSFPYIWLRDNCQCEKCFDQSSLSRSLLVEDLDVDIKAESVELEANEKTVSIRWPDGHQSKFHFDWLKKRGFTAQDRRELDEIFQVKQHLWGSEFQDNVPIKSFEKLLTDDAYLYEWLYEIESKGFVLLQGAPAERGQLQKIGARVAYLKKNNYGETFTVKAKVDPSNLAYTSNSLGLHTDLPYWIYPPGIQMLHCIKQVDVAGGDNEFADGFKVALQLKKEYPDLYRLLTTVPVDYIDVGVDFYKYHKVCRKPIITENAEGEVTQVNYNQMTRDSFFPQDVDIVQEWYRAYKTFNDLLYSDENLIRMKTKEGQIACFHNYRILHGRKGFQVTDKRSERHLEGGYLDWDETKSRRRVLQLELQAKA